MTKFVRTVGLQLKNKSSSTPFPTPRRCSPVAGFIQSPNALRWFGSAWAASYQVERKEQNTEGTCMVIATSAKDNVPSGRAIYNDITAQPGKKYEYSIKPVSVDGIVNHDDCLCIKV